PTSNAARTSHCEARSASSCAGALEFCASWTSLTICASAVSAPTLVAAYWKVPLLLMVAPMTVAPGIFSTGIDSPVTIDSSTCDPPFVTVPSTGNLVAWPDNDGVVHRDFGGGNFHLAAVTYDRRHRRGKIHQGADGFRGPGARPHF